MDKVTLPPAGEMATTCGAAVIGGGPAGLMAAEVLCNAGQRVDLFEGMPSVGRKFLIAGKGGLNLTHSEPRDQFLARYGARRAQLEACLTDFGADQIRNWAENLGVETFTGTSGRVFPTGMKAAPLLYAWRQRLAGAGVIFHMRHKWQGWDPDGALCFDTPDGKKKFNTNVLILALGGASWPQLGSTGEWTRILSERGVPLAPFKPANCGFNVEWSEHFRTKFDGQPLKSVLIEFQGSNHVRLRRQGEFIITATGVEGSLIYALSASIRDEIEAKGSATVYLDLAPDRDIDFLSERLSIARGSHSMARHLEKTVGIKGVKAGLLWEIVPRDDFSNPRKIAQAIKALPVRLESPRPIEEAISSAGGVLFEALDENLMIKSLPGVFCAGEMLDWEAPTGGYLITASCATGRLAGAGAWHWLNKQNGG
jgi:uncharacterized flavoprotein (TIGR03862 family)